MKRTNVRSLALCFRTLIFAGILISIQSCQLEGPDLNKNVSGSATQSTLLECDEAGTSVEFPIDVSELPPGESLEIKGSTLVGPYISKKCMCKIHSYTISISNLSKEDVLAVFGLSELDPSQYTIEDDGNGGVIITIINLAESSDQDMTFQIDIEEGVSIGTITGGGLCIIENVSGVGGTTYIPSSQSHVRPIKVMGPQRLEAYIPIP